MSNMPFPCDPGKRIEQLEKQVKELKATSLIDFINRQRAWSEKTFGPPNNNTDGIIDHISKELYEVRACNGTDVEEWIDIVILAFDGAWRAGYAPEDIQAALIHKLKKNMGRTWPDWRTAEPGKAIEHIREDDGREPESLAEAFGCE